MGLTHAQELAREREANIARNKALLAELELDKPLFEPKEQRPSKSSKKRKAESASGDDCASSKASKILKSESADTAADAPGEVRRSSRNVGKTVDYRKVQVAVPEISARAKAGLRGADHDGPQGREEGTRLHNPKTYGSIPDVEVGTWWETRQQCALDAIHAPWVAGICSGPKGAYSVALSGGYDDDVDEGYAFTYTGSGGRDLKGTKNKPKNLRTGPQAYDQSFDNPFNKALKRSADTKKPVRVIRGFKLKSRYGPSEGYRYDGLYTVEKAWLEKGLNKHGYKVCKFMFKRAAGQPPIPVKSTDDSSAAVRKRASVKSEEEGSEESEEEDGEELEEEGEELEEVATKAE